MQTPPRLHAKHEDPYTDYETLASVSFDETSNFSINETTSDDGVRIELIGELDLAVAGRLRDRLDALSEPGATVMLDLSQLDFIDSSGINVIITYHRHAEQTGWALVVEPQLTLAVRRVINTMGLDEVFWPRPGTRDS